MLKNILKGWNLRSIQAVSWVVCPGSWLALRTLNDKDLLPWLNPKYIPWFGFPLLVIFCGSCLFGFKGLYGIFQGVKDEYNNLKEIERKFNQQKADDKKN